MKNRCGWGVSNELYIHYHDTEWGVPLHDDQKLFEFLTLESFQAGLSWLTVLKKRENFREAFSAFAPEKVVQFDQAKIEELMQNPGIIRNLQKIKSAVNNAQRFLEIQTEFGSFDQYIWAFVDFKPIVNHFETLEDLPAKTALSDKISYDMKKRGFKFIGSTVMYSHMQATGMVNDHIISCFRYEEVQI